MDLQDEVAVRLVIAGLNACFSDSPSLPDVVSASKVVQVGQPRRCLCE